MYKKPFLVIDPSKPNPLRKRYKKEIAEVQKGHLHVYTGGAVCETDAMGFATPENRSPLDLVVDASEGFVPLWAQGVTLRWRFNEISMSVFRDPPAAKAYVRELFARGIALWEDSAPIKFAERHDAWDFEIAVQPQDNCSLNGCTLARAFFPDGGRHDLAIYPKMFEQPAVEQVETMAHEIGHIFGLRHFFAKVSENAWPSQIFGDHNKFSIMNYGPDSKMSDNDKRDLKDLYAAVWGGKLTEVNGTPIEQFYPFSTNRIGSVQNKIAALQRA